METKIKTALAALIAAVVVSAFFVGFYANEAFRPPQKIVYVHDVNVGAGIDKVQIHYWLNDVYQGHHDANITTDALTWLINRTTGFGDNNTLTMIVLGLSNSSANCGASTTHISWIFNDTAGQGNGLGRKTFTTNNITRSTTAGVFNYTAYFYPQESINNVRKVFLALRSDTTYKCYIAVDVLSPTRNVALGDKLTIVVIITFSG